MTTTMVLDCGHAPLPTDTTPYGRDREGRTYCLRCCELRDRTALDERGAGFAYLSSDGRTVTGWPGYVLGHVSREWQTREGFGGRTTRVYVRIDGRTYIGRGPGRGMYIRLRAVKGK